MKDLDKKFFCSNYYDVNLNKYGIKYRTLLRFWENKGWINPIEPYGGFQWYFRCCLGRRSSDDGRQINRWKGIVCRFKGKLLKRSKMLMVDFMNILFYLKLDKFYCIGVMN